MTRLRPVQGYTITAEHGRYTLTSAVATIHVRWTRRGYRCDCGQRGCGHPDVVRTALRTPTPAGWESDLTAWD